MIETDFDVECWHVVTVQRAHDGYLIPNQILSPNYSTPRKARRHLDAIIARHPHARIWKFTAFFNGERDAAERAAFIASLH